LGSETLANKARLRAVDASTRALYCSGITFTKT